MGLYDIVKCEVALPDGFRRGEFQTKTFNDPYMDLYTITAAGRLMCRYEASREPVPESEWMHVGATHPLEQLWHEQSKTRPIYAERDTGYHGILNFYTDSGSRHDGTWKWHEYNAKFTDGNLVEIVQVQSDEA